MISKIVILDIGNRCAFWDTRNIIVPISENLISTFTKFFFQYLEQLIYGKFRLSKRTTRKVIFMAAVFAEGECTAAVPARWSLPDIGWKTMDTKGANVFQLGASNTNQLPKFHHCETVVFSIHYLLCILVVTGSSVRTATGRCEIANKLIWPRLWKFAFVKPSVRPRALQKFQRPKNFLSQHCNQSNRTCRLVTVALNKQTYT